MASSGAGRGGRKTMSGKRNRVLVYILFNSSDIAANVPGMTSEVREFCTTCECLKESLQTQKLNLLYNLFEGKSNLWNYNSINTQLNLKVAFQFLILGISRFSWERCLIMMKLISIVTGVVATAIRIWWNICFTL